MAKTQKFVAKSGAHDRPVMVISMEKKESGAYSVKKKIVYLTADNEKEILG
ncbi:MAG: hypothetical protein KDC10_01045 [Calditrichaeota bacterium]|nr:hypothetical protein [Candidatus Cloacimonadota bacterium]MCB1045758.1 hypothetical protein [Calditrichota bacterium]MCB9472246.1 hypothetical protein [Candidatus Delongbacteria bacterium]